ncbi:hypothetical protein [Streptomyces sp. NPDC019937]|uniref:hypothetical protein n=1 Tax=Streptomyces sp. NPDC019937 TaxID=3154787 RepID=UPI00340436CC
MVRTALAVMDGPSAYRPPQTRDRPQNGAAAGLVCSLGGSGTEAADFWGTVHADSALGYAKDGRIVCRFEPGREHERTGAGRERLAGPMREAGLLPADDRSTYEHGLAVEQPELRALTVAESAFGLDLPRRDVLDGPLLAVRLAE